MKSFLKLPLLVFILMFSNSGFTQIESTSNNTEYQAPTKSDFLELQNTKTYQELKKQKTVSKFKPYTDVENQYAELMDLVEKDFNIEGFLVIDQKINWNTNYMRFSSTGLTLDGISFDGIKVKFYVMDEIYENYIEDFKTVGASFHFWRAMNWESVELGIENNFLYAAQPIQPDKEFGAGQGEKWTVAVQLTDYSLGLFTAPSEEMSKKELIAFTTSKASEPLLQFLHTYTKWHPEVDDFISFTEKNWNVDWSTNVEEDRGVDFLFSGKNKKDSKKIRLGFSCESNDNTRSIPYGLQDNGVEEEQEVKGLNFQFYKSYEYPEGQRGLYVSDGKSFVDIAIDKGTDFKQLAGQIKTFFAMPLNCKKVEEQKKQLITLQPKIIEFANLRKEMGELKRIEGFVNQIEFTKSYIDYIELLKHLPKAKEKTKLESADIESQFKEVMNPIASQLSGDVLQQNRLKLTVLPLNGFVEVPGLTINSGGKLDGKNAEFSIGMFLINQNYSDYLSFYLKEAASLNYPFDGQAFQALAQGNLTTKMVGNLPSYSIESKRLPLHIIGLPIRQHAVLFITAPKSEYSNEELEGVISKLSTTDLVAFAETHKNINNEYWDMMNIFPDQIEGNNQAILMHNNRQAKKELSLQNYDGEIVFAAYGAPTLKTQGGHFYFLMDCKTQGSPTELDKLKTSSEQTNKGNYTVYKTSLPNSRPNEQKVWLVSNQNNPDRHLIYTLDKEFGETKLDEYFGDFFTAKNYCDKIKNE